MASTPSTRRAKTRRSHRAPKNADGTMTLVQHIQELRRRLLVALAAILLGTIVGYLWYGTRVGPIPSLGDILKAPYCSLPPESRFGSSTGDCRLLATGPFEMFVLRLKVGGLAGLVFSSPVWLGQIWGYITPGLKKNEKRWTLGVGGAAGALFVLGAVLAYFVLSQGLEFLMSIGDEAQIAALNGERYFSFAIGLLVIFGVSFEVPLLTVLLNLAGVISYQQLKEKRRYIIVVLFIFAAFATPGQDPVSMVCLALALCFMMEIATQIARFNDRRRKRQRPGWLDAQDETATSIESAAPVAAPTPE
ncbi:twin-arginine translocase subunit TatC, partial [Corynebacterium heidelbergense]